MKQNISAVLLCLLMIASSLAGCMGTDDSTDDSAVAELENEITMQDEKIAELEAEVATLITQHQEAMAELATIQSTLQTTQASLDAAETNATIHQAEISSLEAEREMALAEVSMLNELMSNMSDQSNETLESMALQIAELNQHMSNLSLMLNESYDRHQENVTLVTQLTVERDNLQAALDQANNTIAGYLQDAADAQAMAELQDHVDGIINAVALDSESNGDPRVTITNNGLSTHFSYTSNITEEHTIYVEICNSSDTWEFGFDGKLFQAATGLNWVSMQDDAEIRNYAYRISSIDTNGFNMHGCYILKTPVSFNQFNTSFSYPNLNLFEYSSSSQNPELYISVCKQNDCPQTADWRVPYNGFRDGELHPHYFLGGNVIPVTINSELPCTISFLAGAGSSCQPPSCTDVMENVGSGTYIIDCESVAIGESPYGPTNYTMLNASTIFFEQDGWGDSEIYVCNPSASAYLFTGSWGTADVFILGLGSSDEINHTYTTGNPNSGILETSSGGTFKYKLGAWSDISLLDWNDPDGVC